MSALADAALAILADPTLSVEITWDDGSGVPPVTTRGIYVERPRPPPLTDPARQSHDGPTVRVAVGAVDLVRGGSITIGVRSYRVLHWDRSRDGRTWLIELEEREG